MATVEVWVDVCCPECDCPDVEIVDYSGFELVCYCPECKKHFFAPNTMGFD